MKSKHAKNKANEIQLATGSDESTQQRARATPVMESRAIVAQLLFSPFDMPLCGPHLLEMVEVLPFSIKALFGKMHYRRCSEI